MASLMRRTLMLTGAPISSSARRMEPQVALAKRVCATRPRIAAGLISASPQPRPSPDAYAVADQVAHQRVTRGAAVLLRFSGGHERRLWILPIDRTKAATSDETFDGLNCALKGGEIIDVFTRRRRFTAGKVPQHTFPLRFEAFQKSSFPKHARRHLVLQRCIESNFSRNAMASFTD